MLQRSRHKGAGKLALAFMRALKVKQGACATCSLAAACPPLYLVAASDASASARGHQAGKLCAVWVSSDVEPQPCSGCGRGKHNRMLAVACATGLFAARREQLAGTAAGPHVHKLAPLCWRDAQQTCCAAAPAMQLPTVAPVTDAPDGGHTCTTTRVRFCMMDSLTATLAGGPGLRQQQGPGVTGGGSGRAASRKECNGGKP